MKIDDLLANAPKIEFGKIVEYLDKLPPDQLYTTQEVADNTGVKICNFRADGARFKENTVVFGKKKLWGNKKAIAAFKKKMAERNL